MIRNATHADIPEIARLGAIFHAQAGWDEIPYNTEDCARSLNNLMDTPSFICLVADEGKITGMAAGVISPVYFNHGHVSGEELFWWVSEDAGNMTGLRLLAALEAEAERKGCRTWQMKALSRQNGSRMIKLYERKGYRESELSFIKQL